MTRELVLVHGRSQQGKDPDALKAEWLTALRKGMAKSGLELPVPELQVRFPFYGNALIDLLEGVPDEQVAEIVVRGRAGEPGTADDAAFGDFLADVLDEVAVRKGISEAEIAAEAQRAVLTRGTDALVVERGIANWGWVQGILSAIDRHVPGGSGAAIALATKDVYSYLSNGRTRGAIDDGVRAAMRPGVESVVVSHSLGTVVAYNLLLRHADAAGWKVPLFVTLGSPLAITKIRKTLAPNAHPPCVGKWFNAMDPDDVVSLYPLNRRAFPIDPQVENKTDVDNHTDNQHGIAGYLDDAVVARRIHDALVAA